MMAKRLNAAKVSCVPSGTPAYYVRVTRAGVRHIPAIVLGDEGKKLKIRYQSSTLNIETMTNEAYTVDVGIQRKHIDICDWRIEGVRRRLLEPMVTV